MGLQPTSATVQLLCRELTQKGPFREEREKTLKMPEKKKNSEKQAKRTTEQEGGRDKNGKEEYRQIMRKEKNEEWEEGL